jgi:predicted flap endonuclease-1-like 5' DNA nuclease
MKKQFSKEQSICKVTFQLPQEAAPNAQTVMVVGDFNDWQPQQGTTLKLDRSGFFKAELDLATGQEYQFRYLIDNSRWENDWSADKYVPTPFQGIENSVVSLVEAATVTKAANKVSATPSKQATPKAEQPAVKAEKVTTDDLKKIEGIGSKIAEKLQEVGISTYTNLAKAPLAKLKEVLASAGTRYKMQDPNTWIEQAQLAKEGKWKELKDWQKTLKGGKK